MVSIVMKKRRNVGYGTRASASEEVDLESDFFRWEIHAPLIGSLGILNL